MSKIRTNEIGSLDGVYNATVEDLSTINQRTLYVNSVAELEALDASVGANVKTLGYYTPGDGGGNDYEIVAGGTGTADGVAFINLDNGLQAKNLQIAADSVVSIPTDFPSLQDALDAFGTSGRNRKGSATINIEAGHALTKGFRIDNGDYSWISITSDDSTVFVDPSFSPVSNTDLSSNVPRSAAIGFLGVSAKMPVWDILVDTSAINLQTGFEIDYGSYATVNPGKGVINTVYGSGGGANCRVTTNSDLQAPQSTFTGAEGDNIAVTVTSRANLQNATISGAVNNANLDVSRGSHVHALGADLSNGGTEGLYARRSIVVTQDADFSNNKLGIWAAVGSKVSSYGAIFTGCNSDVKIAHGSLVDVSNAEKSGAQLVASDSIYSCYPSGTAELPKFNGLFGAGVVTDDSQFPENTYLETAQSATGQAIDFLNIPSWARKIIITFVSVSTDGATDDILVQIGTGGSFKTSGYASTGLSYNNAGASSGSNYSTGFGISTNGNASNLVSGQMTLVQVSSSQFISSHNVKKNASNVCTGAGNVWLGGSVDRVRVTLTGTPTDSFDNGFINIRFER